MQILGADWPSVAVIIPSGAVKLRDDVIKRAAAQWMETHVQQIQLQDVV